MADFNPLQLIGNDFQQVVDQSKVSLPFSANDLANQGQQLLQSANNAVASEINEIAAGVRAVVNQQLPFPKKKLVTFFLLNKEGNLVSPSDGSFQPGYLFNMAVNPSSFTIEYPQKTINPIRTMGGWVFQHWYPELGSITADGIIGNLLQRYNDDVKKTPNWDNFKKLIKVYQNNGVAYQTGPIGRNSAQFNPTSVCVYDRVTYYGYFSNFSFTEEQEQPWTRKYNFNFKFYDMIETLDIVERTRQGINSSINSVASSALGTTAASVNSLLLSGGK